MKKITTIPLQSKSKNEIEVVIIYVHGYSFGVKIKPVSMEWFSVSKRTNLKSLKNNVEYIYITKLRCCIYDFIMCYDSDCIWIQLYFIQKCDVNHFVSCMCTTFFFNYTYQYWRGIKVISTTGFYHQQTHTPYLTEYLLFLNKYMFTN